ncbi:NAD(P) transhydrogenase [Panacagrimonas perspica]|uniref:Soluble pyridine nucleotide transhydrogenase n=1 Tax=Panacagrimonas perspica TaxID=381431 RepID=A0A4S3K3D0_9GAMM|nr:Si-specific NAD(P)(+) transhydrogenase [Panacagrimonas perspica]TDU32792.1 NAD(P) transhydrogenase [Panacagrimonas perspica]THD02533.1 NAD(P)(+) transhydrogenase [Panacagrimonas perspica]
MQEFDIVVIGSGPAGEGAAMMAAKNHRRVALVERSVEIGGGCTHWGTIPSKALRHAVKTLSDLRHNPLTRNYYNANPPEYPQLLSSADKVVESQIASRRRYYERNRVPVFEGSASFLDANRIEVRGESAAPEILKAAHFVIASGSRPYHPPDLDFTHPRVKDSDSILRYGHHPFSVTIFGAGVIGCEYASIFVNLGAKVTLVNTQDRLLSFLDEEIAEALSYHLREQGCLIRHQEEYERVEPRERDVVLHLKSGRRIKSDVLLWANGRTGNSDGMGLAELGIALNSRGQVLVDDCYRTALPHIYAVGDVIGPPALASAASVQGRFATQHILDPSVQPQPLEMIPSGIYTIPEISSVGRTERDLHAARVPYEVGHAAFKSLARAQMTGETVGMLKLLFHSETLQVLGVHCFGDRASEIVHIGQTVMADPATNSIRYFINTTFNYPTMAEAYRVAAHNGLNRLA